METVGIGAFMNTGLQSFGWNLKNINSAKLRSIDEYAFRGNAIEKGRTAGADTSCTYRRNLRTTKSPSCSSVSTLLMSAPELSKTTRSVRVVLADTAEEIGEEAFMNNQIVELVVKDRLPGYEDGFGENSCKCICR